jgi:hypothetical protein
LAPKFAPRFFLVRTDYVVNPLLIENREETRGVVSGNSDAAHQLLCCANALDEFQAAFTLQFDHAL